MNDELISGEFHEMGDFDTSVDVSEEEIAAYLKGDYSKLTTKQIAFLREVEDDPDNEKWDAAHANVIFCDREWLYEQMFVYFNDPTWEETYQHLRRLIGPHPLDYVNVLRAIKEISVNQCDQW